MVASKRAGFWARRLMVIVGVGIVQVGRQAGRIEYGLGWPATRNPSPHCPGWWVPPRKKMCGRRQPLIGIPSVVQGTVSHGLGPGRRKLARGGTTTTTATTTTATTTQTGNPRTHRSVANVAVGPTDPRGQGVGVEGIGLAASRNPLHRSMLAG